MSENHPLTPEHMSSVSQLKDLYGDPSMSVERVKSGDSAVAFTIGNPVASREDPQTGDRNNLHAVINAGGENYVVCSTTIKGRGVSYVAKAGSDKKDAEFVDFIGYSPVVIRKADETGLKPHALFAINNHGYGLNIENKSYFGDMYVAGPSEVEPGKKGMFSPRFVWNTIKRAVGGHRGRAPFSETNLWEVPREQLLQEHTNRVAKYDKSDLPPDYQAYGPLAARQNKEGTKPAPAELAPAVEEVEANTSGAMERQWTARQDRALDISAPEAFTRSAVEFLRSHRDERTDDVHAQLAHNARLTEVHLIDGKPIVVVAPRRAVKAGGAKVIGTHSIIDELRLHEDESHYPNFMAFADDPEHRLETSTIGAKGRTQFLEDGRAQLVIMVPRKFERRGEVPSWVGALAEQASELGYDGGVLYAPAYEQRPTRVELGKVQYKSVVRLNSVPESTLPDSLPLSDVVRAGIVTSIKADPSVLKQTQEGGYRKEISVHIEGMDAPIQLHQPLYDIAKISDPLGLQNIEVDGKTFQVGVRYNIDKRDGVRINVFFAEDYGDAVSSLETAVVEGMAEQLRNEMQSSLSGLEMSVTVATPEEFLRRYAV